MDKLVKGVVDFHDRVRPTMLDHFAQVANGQTPDALLVACSDSRVAVNLFASTHPGELFVVRNAGNIIPSEVQENESVHSEAIAVNLAVETLKVRNIIVCGHSNCAAMKAALNTDSVSQSLKRWVAHAGLAHDLFKSGEVLNPDLAPVDQVSQLSVLVQLINLQTYPAVAQAMEAGVLQLHAWWFDVGAGNVYSFEPDQNQFVLIDQTQGGRILERIAKIKLQNGDCNKHLPSESHVRPGALISPKSVRELSDRVFPRHSRIGSMKPVSALKFK